MKQCILNLDSDSSFKTHTPKKKKIHKKNNKTKPPTNPLNQILFSWATIWTKMSIQQCHRQYHTLCPVSILFLTSFLWLPAVTEYFKSQTVEALFSVVEHPLIAGINACDYINTTLVIMLSSQQLLLGVPITILWPHHT